MPEKERTLEELGAYLRSVRESREISTKDVSGKLHIRECYIVAIEDGAMDQFPAPVYARGFIRNYLGFLKEEALWEEYLALFPQKQEEETGVQSLSATPRGFRRVTVGWLYLLLILLVAGGGFFGWTQRSLIYEALHRDSKPSPPGTVVSAETPETPEAGDLAAVPSVKPLETPSPTPEVVAAGPGVSVPSLPAVSETEIPVVPLPSAAQEEARREYPWLYETGSDTGEEALDSQKKELQLSCSSSCWMRVARGNKVLFVGTLKKGETRRFPLEKTITVRMGNSGAVAAEWWGKTKKTLGKTGEVKTVYFEPQGGFRDS